jgi:hypothetical protein
VADSSDLTRQHDFGILAMSAIVPDCPGLAQATDPLFALVEAGKYEKYPILCITNLTVVPKNAGLAGKLLHLILRLVNSDGENSEDAIVILFRVVIAPESSAWMNQLDIAQQFLETFKKNWKPNTAGLLVAMLYHFASLALPRQFMKENGMIESVAQKLASSKIHDPYRPQLLQVRSWLVKCD